MSAEDAAAADDGPMTEGEGDYSEWAPLADHVGCNFNHLPLLNGNNFEHSFEPYIRKQTIGKMKKSIKLNRRYGQILRKIEQDGSEDLLFLREIIVHQELNFLSK